MNELLNNLARSALVGSARQHPALPSVAGPAGVLLTQLAATDQAGEAMLLRAAGVAAICGSAGIEPGTQAPAPGAAPPDSARLLPPATVSAMADVLADGPERLQWLCLHRLTSTGTVLHPALLPSALELGRRLGRLRPPLLPVLGQRGDWLAAQNPDWAWARTLPDAEGLDWDNATHEQRLNWLDSNLASQPAQAREYLQASLPGLGARERLQLLEKLAPHVVAADEAFLESLRTDRSKEVRQTALRLLSTLPGSAFARCMGERMAKLLSRRRKLLREVLEFTPPEQFDPEWKKDGIEAEKPAHETLGERAWWALQLIRLTPLDWWPAHTGLSPAQLLAWAGEGDWQQVLLSGWLQALDTQQSPDWAEAWLNFAAPKKMRVEPYQLLRKLPQEKREAYWLKLFQALQGGENLGQHLNQLLASLNTGQLLQSSALARAVLQELRNYPLQRDYPLMQAIPELACILPDVLLPEVRDTALHEALARIGSQDGAARFARIVEHRLTLSAALQDAPQASFQERMP